MLSTNCDRRMQHWTSFTAFDRHCRKQSENIIDYCYHPSYRQTRTTWWAKKRDTSRTLHYIAREVSLFGPPCMEI